MIVYEVRGYDRIDESAAGDFFASKGEAIKTAKADFRSMIQTAKNHAKVYGETYIRPTDLEVVRYDLGKIDRAKIIAILRGVGFAESIETVWTTADYLTP